jgi:hypothetical protein
MEELPGIDTSVPHSARIHDAVAMALLSLLPVQVP